MSVEMAIRVVTSTDGTRWRLEQFRGGAWVEIEKVIEVRMVEEADEAAKDALNSAIDELRTAIENF